MSARYVVMDFETTGINKYHNDEVVQVAIINQDDEILLHELCCPKHHFSWVDAQKVHGITPAMVKNKMPFEHYLEQIISIFEDYDFIVCYNIAFEKGMLENYGIDVSKYQFHDPMKEFAPIYGEKSYRGGYKWKSLTVCAQYFGFEFKAHDALEDVKATRYCFDKIQELKNHKKQLQEATIDNWQSLFRKQIINNGQQIYDNNSVDIIYQEKQQIVASVKGSQDYLVSIIVEQGKIKKMACNCPYAMRGNKCKHMAALLMKINE